MDKVFIDSAAFVAISNKNDQFHKMAVEINKSLLISKVRYITTNFILDESITILRLRIGHASTVDFHEKIIKSGLIEIIHISELIEEQAWHIFKKFSDKEFSFTDCTSFAVMKEHKITASFTNDHHFEQMGFEVLIK